MSAVRRVVVGMSGGVDSAVSAFLLKKKGFEVIGAFIKCWDLIDETGCSTIKDLEDAKYVCKTLGIPFVEVDFVKEYWNDVFSYIVKELENGGTPSGDVICNKRIKFDVFFKHATEVLKADALATGHYARTTFGPYLEYYKPLTDARLLIPFDMVKDQTYFLGQMSQNSLRRTMFPLGEFNKAWTKAIARERGLDKILKKPESMGMCFIGSRNFYNFVSDYLVPKKGKIVHLVSRKVLGEHEGIFKWTLGQRTGISNFREPVFVASKNVETNEIYVVNGRKHPALYTQIFYTDVPHWIASPQWDLNLPLTCGFRSQNRYCILPCTILTMSSGKLMVFTKEPHRCLTPGQFAVFYYNDECLGSARIELLGPSYFTLGKTIPEDHVEKLTSDFYSSKLPMKRKDFVC